MVINEAKPGTEVVEDSFDAGVPRDCLWDRESSVGMTEQPGNSDAGDRDTQTLTGQGSEGSAVWSHVLGVPPAG